MGLVIKTTAEFTSISINIYILLNITSVNVS